jgi:hypothetical protein
MSSLEFREELSGRPEDRERVRALPQDVRRSVLVGGLDGLAEFCTDQSLVMGTNHGKAIKEIQFEKDCNSP